MRVPREGGMASPAWSLSEGPAFQEGYPILSLPRDNFFSVCCNLGGASLFPPCFLPPSSPRLVFSRNRPLFLLFWLFYFLHILVDDDDDYACLLSDPQRVPFLCTLQCTPFLSPHPTCMPFFTHAHSQGDTDTLAHAHSRARNFPSPHSVTPSLT
jgi:hypothetical protein